MTVPNTLSRMTMTQINTSLKEFQQKRSIKAVAMTTNFVELNH